MFMSAHAVVKGCVGVAKVLPYILNMLVRPVDQLAMLRYRISLCGGRGTKRQLNEKAAKTGSKNHLATERVIYTLAMIRAGKVATKVGC